MGPSFIASASAFVLSAVTGISFVIVFHICHLQILCLTNNFFVFENQKEATLAFAFARPTIPMPLKTIRVIICRNSTRPTNARTFPCKTKMLLSPPPLWALALWGGLHRLFFYFIFLYSWLFEAAFNGNLYNLHFIFMRWPFRSSIVACHSSAVYIHSGCRRVRVCKIVWKRGRRSRDTILFKTRAAEQQQHLGSEADVSAGPCVLSWAWGAARLAPCSYSRQVLGCLMSQTLNWPLFSPHETSLNWKKSSFYTLIALDDESDEFHVENTCNCTLRFPYRLAP